MKRITINTTMIGKTASEMTQSPALRKAIRRQPGYRPGTNMRVMRVAGRNAYRLYADVDGRWMDASLNDM